MLSFEPELTSARDEAAISPATAARLFAVQRREIFSLFAEIRTLAWIGAMLVASGVSVFISKHINEIGPLTIAIVLAVAAAACYAWAWMRRNRQSLVNDSILLLGAMLVSADAGWIESQWHTFGPRALLFLAIFHAIGAYRYNSRALLSLSIGALAGWFGIDRKIDFIFSSSVDLALRAFVCAAIIAVWREADRRFRKATVFTPVFDHTALSLAFAGALILTTNRETSDVGVLVTLALAVVTAVYAFRADAEPYLLYAAIFTTIALDTWIWQNLSGDALRSFLTLILAIAAVVFLMTAHRRFRSRTT
jgi:hypothetical protein